MDVTTPQFWLRIGVAMLCGTIVGFERQMRGKPAGMRTSVLICLGTAIFMRVGIEQTSGQADPTRVLGQIVTGVGFLGGGVILTQNGLVRGVTSAAVVWVLAGVGAAIGADRFLEAISLAGTTVAVLLGVEALEKLMRKLGLIRLAQGALLDDPEMDERPNFAPSGMPAPRPGEHPDD